MFFMQFINVWDEKNRFVLLKVDLDGAVGQNQSHTYSYLYGREVLQEIGDEMGLDRISDEDWAKFEERGVMYKTDERE